MLTLLMFRGANVNSVDKKDRRPIHYAAFMGKTRTAQKKKFSIKDFFSKCGQIRSSANLFTFTEEILNGKLHFLCSAVKRMLIVTQKH